MGRFQLHTVPWCRRTSSRRGVPPPLTHASGSSSQSSGRRTSWRAIACSKSSYAPSVTHPVPKDTRATRRTRRPRSLRSSTACLNSATRVSSHRRCPRNVGELPATASTGAVASWAALKSAAKSAGAARRWICREVAAPSKVTSSHSISRGSAPSMRTRKGSCRMRRSAAERTRKRGWSVMAVDCRSSGRRVGRMPMTATRPPWARAARRTSVSASSISRWSTPNGRPASDVWRRLHSRLKRSSSTVTRGSTVSPNTFRFNGSGRVSASTSASSSSAPIEVAPSPNPGRSSSSRRATRQRSSRKLKRW